MVLTGAYSVDKTEALQCRQVRDSLVGKTGAYRLGKTEAYSVSKEGGL